MKTPAPEGLRCNVHGVQSPIVQVNRGECELSLQRAAWEHACCSIWQALVFAQISIQKQDEETPAKSIA